ncbi:MAG TPA: MFS transporter, partial [Solirubrobacter sp.]|nr:MFS transporter [Solirubrobacter sp.]
MFASALRRPAARRFFAAHAQSSLGTGLALLALPLIALDRFGSPLAVSAVLLPDLLPAIVLGPLVGALVDRVGWRRCAAAADILRCAGFLLAMRAHALPLMMAGAALAGIGTALFHPSALSGLTQLAGEQSRPAALALFGAVDDVGTTLGPALGGVLLTVAGPAALLGANAATFAVSALAVASLRVPVVAGEPFERRAARRSLLADVRAGVREAAARPQVRLLLASSLGIVLCIGVTSVGEVVLAREVLGIGGSGLALMITAGGVGTV